MSISIDSIKKILDLRNEVLLTPEAMAKNLKATFLVSDNLSPEILNFKNKLELSFTELGVDVIPYAKSFDRMRFKNIIRRTLLYFKIILKIIISIFRDFKKFNPKMLPDNFFQFCFGGSYKKNIAIFVFGEVDSVFYPINHVNNLKDNPIITVIEKKDEVKGEKNFNFHMDKALSLFSKLMTNIAITVSAEAWTIYSFNLSHPTYGFDDNFKNNILNSLITKISAPVVPPKMKEFIIKDDNFEPNDEKYKFYINDMVVGSKLLKETNLFPEGRLVSDLNFKNYFYRYIGEVHLDKRNGMSYGFIARQLPVLFSEVKEISSLDIKKFGLNDYYFDDNNCLFIKVEVFKKDYVLKVPEVWVLTTRSGCDKTNINQSEDIIKIGLVNGKMMMELPTNFQRKQNYRPSFDTRIILAHAVSNAIFGSIINKFNPGSDFAVNLGKSGMAIVHWHGYINNNFLPKGFIVYGKNNPSVSCSALQTSIYAMQQKEHLIVPLIEKNEEYVGDFHIEPQHGVNVVYDGIVNLAKFLLSDKNISELGNKYFN